MENPLASKGKLKGLGIVLSSFSGFEKPKPELEQWATPGEIAATMLSLAAKDIAGKKVCDLGAGTGILCAGALLLGASHVTAVEIDPLACDIARKNLEGLGFSKGASIVNSDAVLFSGGQFDTVIMNPPFGAQRKARHLDREFLKTAFSLAPVVYSLHLSQTRTFIRGFSEGHGFKDAVLGTFLFPLSASFEFHRKPKKTAEVDYHRIWK